MERHQSTCNHYPVDVSGKYAYVTTEASAVEDGLLVIDVSNPVSPTLAGEYSIWWANARDVSVVANYAYVAYGSAGLQVVDITAPITPTKSGECDVPGNARKVTVAGKYAYVIDELGDLHVINISGPTHPVLVGDLDLPDNTSSVAVKGNYAYVGIAETGSNLRVLRVANPTDPAQLSSYAIITGTVHDVTLVNDYAYVAAGEAGLRVLDISDPANPIEIGAYNAPEPARGVAVSGDYAYVVDDEGGFFVFHVPLPTPRRSYLPVILRQMTKANVLMLHFDQDAGATSFDDSSGYDNHGSCSGDSCPTAGATGRVSNTLHFDGVSDFVTLGNPASMNFVGEITIEAWVNVEATDGVRNIVAHGYATAPAGEVVLRIVDETYEIGSMSTDGVAHVTTYPIPARDKGKWVHLTGTYDGSAWRLYRNGVEVSSTPNATGAVLVNENWAIGARGAGTARFFQGSIDEVGIYNWALSAAEVFDHYQAKSNVLLMHLDENVGAISFEDSSGYGNHGSCSGVSCPTAGEVGHPNKALHFDGVDDFVSLGNPTSMNLGNEITIEAWINTEATDGVRNIVAHGHSTAPLKEVVLRIVDGAYEIGSLSADGTGHKTTYPVPAGDVGKWVHLVGTYDGVAWRLYRNGVEVNSTSDATGAVTIGEDWAIGARGTGTERFFQGLIDEVAIHYRALSADQVSEQYKAMSNVLLMHLDENAGATHFDDASMYDNHGSCSGDSCPTAGVAGRVDNGMHFDGVDDYVSLGNPTSMNFVGEITIEAWVNVETTDGVQNIVAHGHTTSPAGEVVLRVADGTYGVGSMSSDGTVRITSYPIPAGDVGNWIHLAGVYDGVMWRLYRNGVEVSSTTNATGSVLVNGDWAIGARGNGTERFFQGTIDNVAVHNRALSAEEIVDHYNVP